MQLLRNYKPDPKLKLGVQVQFGTRNTVMSIYFCIDFKNWFYTRKCDNLRCIATEGHPMQCRC